ncbi:MAG: TolC family outer membrane protein [Sphingobium sp.]
MPKITRLAGSALTTAALALTAQTAGAETLREALAQAYKTNPRLMAARADLRATDEGVSLAKAQGRPDAGVSGTYSENIYRESLPGLGFTTPKRDISASASLDVPIYQGGTVRNTIRSAKERVSAGQNSLRGTESSVFATAVAAYLDVIRDSAIVTLNKQNVEALDVNLQASSDRFEVGDLTRTDVAQSQSRLALARASYESAQAQLIGSKERYMQIIGSPPTDLQNPPSLPGLPNTPEEAVSIALQDNPDLLAARDFIDAAHYETNAAKGRVAPRVSGFVDGGYRDYLNSEKDLNTAVAPAGSAKSAAAGIRVTIPIYQGGQPGALARQNAARESSAMEQAMEAERSVVAQTRSTYAAWRAALQTIESTRGAVDAATLSLEGVRAENSAGTRTILDILDSQRDLLNAQVQYVSAQRDAYVAAFSLLAAMGHAEARDLNLEDVTIYEPDQNYRRVRNKLFDFDFDAQPKPVSTSTAQTPAQTSDVIIPSQP